MGGSAGDVFDPIRKFALVDFELHRQAEVLVAALREADGRRVLFMHALLDDDVVPGGEVVDAVVHRLRPPLVGRDALEVGRRLIDRHGDRRRARCRRARRSRCRRS